MWLLQGSICSFLLMLALLHLDYSLLVRYSSSRYNSFCSMCLSNFQDSTATTKNKQKNKDTCFKTLNFSSLGEGSNQTSVSSKCGLLICSLWMKWICLHLIETSFVLVGFSHFLTFQFWNTKICMAQIT